MKHFPIFLNIAQKRVVVAGAGETATAKLRLLLKTEALISVFGENPTADVLGWANADRIKFAPRPIDSADLENAVVLYCATDDAVEDARLAGLTRGTQTLTAIVDNLNDSDFITPAIVDRDPVTVAIGTEGAAPVLARKIKADIEVTLPPTLGRLARVGQAFRQTAEALPQGLVRRNFWSSFYFRDGPAAWAAGGKTAAQKSLDDLHSAHLTSDAPKGRVALVGAGPGDPELLTTKARRLLHNADVVIHDQLVAPDILELARREAIIIETGKRGFGRAWKQTDINALMVTHAAGGAQVVRLKGGDPVVFGRLDEEIEALEAAGVAWEIVPGITATSAAAAAIGQSLTKRLRNSSLRFLTGHDIDGFAEHEWRDLAGPGATAAVYMGKSAATFLRGRLLMHGAASDTPITAVENVSRVDQRVLSATLVTLPDVLAEADTNGPVILLLGLAPRDALKAVQSLPEAIQGRK